MITVYGIPNCDTIKRARTWLSDQGLEYSFHDYKKAGVPADHLARWISALGWEKVVNRSGTAWRKLDDDTRAGVVDAASAAKVVTANPSVIKRPIVEWNNGSLSLGFSPELYEQHLK